jgi:type I restriction enzyme, S subunit
MILLLPDLPEQRAIAHILGTLDDKIELNRRMNETLEAMARALFKSWFVDFDPVRAKAEGRDPGLPHPLADLFPGSFEDSELGEIPKGWEVTKIGVVADVIDCLHSKKPERRTAGFPLLQLSNIRADGLLDLNDSYFISKTDYKKWISRMEATSGDCVVTNVGRVGAAAQIPVGVRAALGRNMTGLRCRGDFPYPTVLIECLLSQAMKDEILQKVDTGTILDALNVRNIPKLRFVRATADALHAFESLARPLRARMEMSLEESQSLAALRDTLLPKLISGELRVKDAETIAARAV